MLSQEQRRRVTEALTETMAYIEKYTHQRTFDKHQEATRVQRLNQGITHSQKLMAMLEGNKS